MRERRLKDITKAVEHAESGYNLYRGDGSNKQPITVVQKAVLQQMEYGKWYEQGDFRWETMNSLVSKQMIIVARTKRYDNARIEDRLLDAIFHPNSDPVTAYRLATSEDLKEETNEGN